MLEALNVGLGFLHFCIATVLINTWFDYNGANYVLKLNTLLLIIILTTGSVWDRLTGIQRDWSWNFKYITYLSM